MIRSDTKSKYQLNTAHKKHTLNINAKSRRLKMIYYTYTNQKNLELDTWITVQIDFTKKNIIWDK